MSARTVIRLGVVIWSIYDALSALKNSKSLSLLLEKSDCGGGSCTRRTRDSRFIAMETDLIWHFSHLCDFVCSLENMTQSFLIKYSSRQKIY